MCIFQRKVICDKRTKKWTLDEGSEIGELRRMPSQLDNLRRMAAFTPSYHEVLFEILYFVEKFRHFYAHNDFLTIFSVAISFSEKF